MSGAAARVRPLRNNYYGRFATYIEGNGKANRTRTDGLSVVGAKEEGASEGWTNGEPAVTTTSDRRNTTTSRLVHRIDDFPATSGSSERNKGARQYLGWGRARGEIWRG